MKKNILVAVMLFAMTLSGLAQQFSQISLDGLGFSNPQNVSGLTIDKNDNKWISCGTKIAMYDNENWTVYTTPLSDANPTYITTIEVDSKGNIWAAGTYRTTDWPLNTFLLFYEIDSQNWTVYDKNDQILSNGYMILDIAIDRYDNLWIAREDFYGNGVVKFDGETCTFFDYMPEDIPIPGTHYPSQIVIDDNDNKYFIYARGLVKYDNSEFTYFDIPDFEQGACSAIAKICVDKDNNPWLSASTYDFDAQETSHFIGKLVNNEWILFDDEDVPLYEYEAIQLFVDNNNILWGNRWIIDDPNRNFPLLKYENNEWFEYNHENSDLPQGIRFSKIEVDKCNNFWCLRKNVGLYEFNLDGISNNCQSNIPGDLNNDFQVTISDVQLIVRVILGESNINILNGDVNGDGNIDISDVMGITSIVLGL